MFPPKNSDEISARQFYEKYMQGDRDALVLLIAHCAKSNIQVPEDAANDFYKCISDWKELKTRTLNESLRINERKGWRLADLRKRNEFALCVYMAVEQLRKKGLPVDANTFAIAGKEYGYSASAVRDIYYEHKEILRNYDHEKAKRELIEKWRSWGILETETRERSG